MKIPSIHGVIDRRILVNYRVAPSAIEAMLPEPFRPLLVKGHSIAGICLIRLAKLRPTWMPFPIGFGSENAAHRIAVEWESENKTHHGVYIPRRDTDSRLVSLVGGRLFPGVHHHSEFEVHESETAYRVAMRSSDGSESVSVNSTISDSFPSASIFDSLSDASRFFEMGSLGYSDTSTQNRFDGLELSCLGWKVQSLDVDGVQSSFFENQTLFPADTIAFDCSLLMRNIQHKWSARPDLCCSPTP